jgi:DNA-binding transcriptional LysR family regulator
VTITDVPELSPGTIERQHLYDEQIVTVCAPAHPLAAIAGPIPREELGRHIQLVVTDNCVFRVRKAIDSRQAGPWFRAMSVHCS